MIALSLLATLCGAVLAFRFKALVLYPLILAASIGILALGLDKGTDAGSIALQIACVAITLQFGYVFGMLGRGAMAASRVSAMRERTANRTQPV